MKGVFFQTEKVLCRLSLELPGYVNASNTFEYAHLTQNYLIQAPFPPPTLLPHSFAHQPLYLKYYGLFPTSKIAVVV